MSTTAAALATCARCLKELPRASYSTNQWKGKGASGRLCKLCVGLAILPGARGAPPDDEDDGGAWVAYLIASPTRSSFVGVAPLGALDAALAAHNGDGADGPAETALLRPWRLSGTARRPSREAAERCAWTVAQESGFRARYAALSACERIGYDDDARCGAYDPRRALDGLTYARLEFAHPTDASRSLSVRALVDTGSNDCELRGSLIEKLRLPKLEGSVVSPRPRTEPGPIGRSGPSDGPTVPRAALRDCRRHHDRELAVPRAADRARPQRRGARGPSATVTPLLAPRGLPASRGLRCARRDAPCTAWQVLLSPSEADDAESDGSSYESESEGEEDFDAIHGFDSTSDDGMLGHDALAALGLAVDCRSRALVALPE